jgi:hypothetical protein
MALAQTDTPRFAGATLDRAGGGSGQELLIIMRTAPAACLGRPAAAIDLTHSGVLMLGHRGGCENITDAPFRRDVTELAIV